MIKEKSAMYEHSIVLPLNFSLTLKYRKLRLKDFPEMIVAKAEEKFDEVYSRSSRNSRRIGKIVCSIRGRREPPTTPLPETGVTCSRDILTTLLYSSHIFYTVSYSRLMNALIGFFPARLENHGTPQSGSGSERRGFILDHVWELVVSRDDSPLRRITRPKFGTGDFGSRGQKVRRCGGRRRLKSFSRY
ncbi:hypothetical protein CEXT_361591 [Caerostris extrusa]|uniref:Uncharacterized protein n=1 Tax=Caerostris extrusa TaxID=172846 RepID=A0AAV4WHQ0_CAEEX|nr:hypothetical protein CEXT_361591 [Caerostris extrusa]